MKETEQIIEDKIENVKQVLQVEQQANFLGLVKVSTRGLKMFEINKDTREINLVEIKEKVVLDATAIGGRRIIKDVITKENHFYTVAMNKKNALKKYEKFLINGPKK